MQFLFYGLNLSTSFAVSASRLIDFGTSIALLECGGGRTNRYCSITKVGEEVKYNTTTVSAKQQRQNRQQQGQDNRVSQILWLTHYLLDNKLVVQSRELPIGFTSYTDSLTLYRGVILLASWHRMYENLTLPIQICLDASNPHMCPPCIPPQPQLN